jgi:site-specific recombinase XerD
MSNKALTAQQIAFAKIYAETGDAIKAYKEAYGEERANNVKWLKSNAYHKLQNPNVKALINEIQQAMRAQFILMSPEALENLWNLANNAESEKVRLEANKEILYGAGLRPAEEVKLTTTGIFGSASVDDIREAIRKNLEESTDNKVEVEEAKA